MWEVKALKRQNAEKDKRMADLEQYTRMNDIISRLDTRSRSFAFAVTTRDGGAPTEPDLESLEQVTAFFLNKGISMDQSDIDACHPLP